MPQKQKTGHYVSGFISGKIRHQARIAEGFADMFGCRAKK
jgi:hypothetical protein